MGIIRRPAYRDYLHIFVSAPPHLSVSQFVQSLKGKSSRKLQMDFKALSWAFRGRHFGAKGYVVACSENVTEEVIVNYIEQQGNETPEEHFQVDDDL